MQWHYLERNREGDHICYYSDLARLRTDYPEWQVTKNLQQTVEEIVEGWHQRLHAEAPR